MSSNFNKLNKSIINCKKCKRLARFRKRISKEKRKQYQHLSKDLNKGKHPLRHNSTKPTNKK